MTNKLKQVKKYLSDKYYIEDWEWCRGVSISHENWAHYGDRVNIFIICVQLVENLCLDNVSAFDILKIKKMLKGSGVVLMIDDECVDYE